MFFYYVNRDAETGSQVSLRSAKSSTTIMVGDDDGQGHDAAELELAAENLEAVLEDDDETAEGEEQTEAPENTEDGEETKDDETKEDDENDTKEDESTDEPQKEKEGGTEE